VKSGGRWDYKSWTSDNRYEAFGNYNYGFTGRHLGFPAWMLERAAGAYQEFGGTDWDPDNGHFWEESPYGDYSEDQKWIQEGIRDFEEDYQGLRYGPECR